MKVNVLSMSYSYMIMRYWHLSCNGTTCAYWFQYYLILYSFRLLQLHFVLKHVYWECGTFYSIYIPLRLIFVVQDIGDGSGSPTFRIPGSSFWGPESPRATSPVGHFAPEVLRMLNASREEFLARYGRPSCTSPLAWDPNRGLSGASSPINMHGFAAGFNPQ